MEYEQMTEKIKYGKRVESLARQFCAYVFQEATSSSITDGSLDYGMCYAEDTASLSIWNFSGFAFAAVLAIIAVIVMVSYIVYMVYKLIKDMKSKMAEVEENMKSLREEVRGMNSTRHFVCHCGSNVLSQHGVLQRAGRWSQTTTAADWTPMDGSCSCWGMGPKHKETLGFRGTEVFDALEQREHGRL
jgi:hypothetical protein